MASALLISLTAPPANALAKFSRACKWSDIPRIMEPAALDLFHIISSAPLGKFNYLFFADKSKRDAAFILESITVDYGSLQYNLYAENEVYESRFNSANRFIGYQKAYQYTSSGWQSNTLPVDVTKNSRLDIFFQNRTFLYSARAGDPEIIQQFPDAAPGRFYKFKVIGYHAYYDFSLGVTVSIGKSEAYDCNLLEWGFGTR